MKPGSSTRHPSSSPIIALASAGHLRLFELLDVEVWIPGGVVHEVMEGPESDPARQALEAGWGRRLEITAIPPAVLEWNLGTGESEVIAAGLQGKGGRVVLDDAEARNCAQTLGVSFLGTLGVVLAARRSGLVESAGKILQDLIAAGLYCDPALLRQILKGVGESWNA